MTSITAKQMDSIGSVLKEIRADNTYKNDPVKEYDTPESLLSAYVNDGITSGISTNHNSVGTAANLIVYGNTLYFDEGCNIKGESYYFQVAIRLTEGVYLLNDISKHRAIQYGTLDAIRENQATYGRYIVLNTLMEKKEEGEVNLHILKNIIQEYAPGRIKVALRMYAKDRMCENTIESYKYLISTHQAMKTPSKVELSKGIIRDMTGALKKVQKAHILLSEYLDILQQLPEKPTP